MYGFKFLFWGQVTVQGLFLCVLGTNMALNLVNIREIRASTIKLFYKLTAISERLSEKVHATILKGIVGGFEFNVVQRNLKEWHKRPWTCLRLLKEATKVGSTDYTARNRVLIISNITFQDCRVHIFSAMLSIAVNKGV